MRLSAIDIADIAAGPGGFVILGEPISGLAGRAVPSAATSKFRSPISAPPASASG